MTDLPQVPSAGVGQRLVALESARGADADRPVAGRRLAALLGGAGELREEIVRSGRPSGIATGDLVTWSLPTSLVLGHAVRGPAPWAWLTSRMLVVQWRDPDRAVRTLLWQPSDHARAPATPYHARRGSLTRGPGRPVSHGTVTGHLRALGIDPASVDYLAFSDLRHQDVRRLVGTTSPAPDLTSHDDPVTGWFPHATLLIRRQEWEGLEHLHPLSALWYQPWTFTDLDPERIGILDDDVLLGPGVALVATPGRSGGHTSLVLHADDGVWVASANGVAADAWMPRASRIPGLREWSVAWEQDVLPQVRISESAAAQHDSMLLERVLADPSATAPFPRCLPTAELTPHRLARRLAPAHRHGRIASGVVRGSPLVAHG